MANRSAHSHWLVWLGTFLASLGCGGKTALEIDSLDAPSFPGDTTSGTSDLDGIGGGMPSTTVKSSGGATVVGTGAGGRSLATGGRIACPDQVSEAMAPFTIEGDLGEYADRYAPSCLYTPNVPEFAFVWFVSEPNTYVIDTFGSEVDTALAVYSGHCGNSELTCDDDDGTFSKQSRIAFDVALAGVVTLVVDGPPGAFRLNVFRASSLVDSVLSQELPIQVTGTTVGKANRATSSCNGKTPSNDTFFLFQAPDTGTYQFLVESNNFDAVLSLRDGGPAGAEVTCNDGFVGVNPSISYALGVGQSVALVVDGFQGQEGFFKLYVTHNLMDSGSCCSSSNVRGGCTDASVMQCVCKQRHDCCYYYWDTSCVAAVDELGCGTCSLD